MAVSKRSLNRRYKRKFIRYKFQKLNGRKTYYYHQGLADGRAGYKTFYVAESSSSNHYKILHQYFEGYRKGKSLRPVRIY